MKKGLLKRFFKAVGLGVVDSVPLLSSIKNNLQEAHKATDENPEAGKGTVNWVRLLTASLLVATFVLYFMGKLTEENFVNLLETIKNL